METLDDPRAAINRDREGLGSLPWGAHAQRKRQLIDSHRHRGLRSVHLSPLSDHCCLLGCGHFSAVNHNLDSRGQPSIDWSLLPSASPQAASGFA